MGNTHSQWKFLGCSPFYIKIGWIC